MHTHAFYDYSVARMVVSGSNTGQPSLLCNANCVYTHTHYDGFAPNIVMLNSSTCQPSLLCKKDWVSDWMHTYVLYDSFIVEHVKGFQNIFIVYLFPPSTNLLSTNLKNSIYVIYFKYRYSYSLFWVPRCFYTYWRRFEGWRYLTDSI